MTMLFVTYAGDASTRLDRDYYVSTHLPLVLKAWEPHGLKTVAAFFPVGDGADTIAIAVCMFQNEAANGKTWADGFAGGNSDGSSWSPGRSC